MTTSDTVERFRRAILDGFAAGDVEAFIALYAEDAVHEFPFAPPELPERIEGKEAIAAYMRQLPGRISFESFDLSLHATDDPDLIVGEAEAHGRRLNPDGPFHQRYVWFITVRDGQILRWKDYMNPLLLRAALG